MRQSGNRTRSLDRASTNSSVCDAIMESNLQSTGAIRQGSADRQSLRHEPWFPETVWRSALPGHAIVDHQLSISPPAYFQNWHPQCRIAILSDLAVQLPRINSRPSRSRHTQCSWINIEEQTRRHYVILPLFRRIYSTDSDSHAGHSGHRSLYERLCQARLWCAEKPDPVRPGTGINYRHLATRWLVRCAFAWFWWPFA
jgi:hypothetical protein